MLEKELEDGQAVGIVRICVRIVAPRARVDVTVLLEELRHSCAGDAYLIEPSVSNELISHTPLHVDKSKSRTSF